MHCNTRTYYNGAVQFTSTTTQENGNIMTLIKSQVYTTTDGEHFTAHKEAKAHQDTITRGERIRSLFENDLNFRGFNDQDAQHLAVNAAALMEALTIPPARRAPRQPKAAVVAP